MPVPRPEDHSWADADLQGSTRTAPRFGDLLVASEPSGVPERSVIVSAEVAPIAGCGTPGGAPEPRRSATARAPGSCLCSLAELKALLPSAALVPLPRGPERWVRPLVESACPDLNLVGVVLQP